MKKMILAAVALLSVGMAFTATPSQAQGYGYHTYGGGGGWHAPSLQWSGHVDDTVNIYFRGTHSWIKVLSGAPSYDAVYQFNKPLPQNFVKVNLYRGSGRGNVYTFQQPNPGNNFTAGVRIEDPQPGRGYYSFSLRWHQ